MIIHFRVLDFGAGADFGELQALSAGAAASSISRHRFRQRFTMTLPARG